jgi:hypothetical protein
MPTEIRPANPPFIAPSNVHSLSPLAVAATIAFAILHLVSGVMLERSHASPADEVSAFAALDDEANCLSEMKPPEPSLPYD